MCAALKDAPLLDHKDG